MPRADAPSSATPAKVDAGKVDGGEAEKVNDPGNTLALGTFGAGGGAGEMAQVVEEMAQTGAGELGRAAWKGLALLYMHRARVVPFPASVRINHSEEKLVRA